MLFFMKIYLIIHTLHVRSNVNTYLKKKLYSIIGYKYFTVYTIYCINICRIINTYMKIKINMLHFVCIEETYCS